MTWPANSSALSDASRQQSRPMPLKVVHVVKSLNAGGAERLVVDLVQAGRELDQQAAVVCLEEAGSLARRLIELPSPVICLHKRPGVSVTAMLQLRRTLYDLRSDVVHTHQTGALLHVGPVSLSARRPLIVHTQHGRHRFTTLRHRMARRLMAHCAARIFCVSNDIARQTRQLGIAPGWKLEVIPNGINTRAFLQPSGFPTIRRSLGIPLTAPVIGAVGRLEQVKRHDTLLRVFVAVQRRFPEARLLIVGDGPAMSRLQDLAHDLAVSRSVHFVGYQDQVAPYLHAMDVFVLASESEGLPLAVLEAAAANVPVVASRIGGLPELFRHTRTGLLCDPHDDNAFVNAVVTLFDDKLYARALSAEAQQLVCSRYDIQRVALDYHDQYLRLLGRVPAAHQPATFRRQ